MPEKMNNANSDFYKIILLPTIFKYLMYNKLQKLLV